MTELQMGLIGLGATAVIGVLGYNKWQEYRHRKLAEAVLKPQHDDVLLADAPAKVTPAVRSEPELRAEAPDAPLAWQESSPALAAGTGRARGGERRVSGSLARGDPGAGLGALPARPPASPRRARGSGPRAASRPAVHHAAATTAR